MDTLPGPHLVTVEQIDSLPKGSLLEVLDGSSSTVYLYKGGYWAGSNGEQAYYGNRFPIGKTYLIRSGPLK